MLNFRFTETGTWTGFITERLSEDEDWCRETWSLRYNREPCLFLLNEKQCKDFDSHFVPIHVFQVQVDDPEIASQLLDESSSLGTRYNAQGATAGGGSRRSSAGQQASRYVTNCCRHEPAAECVVFLCSPKSAFHSVDGDSECRAS